ncbi:MAG: glycosyltransferase [Calothrix sp. MO_167.B42]|nr:glycosyltransferase [Calothrix sp. MO_167.B42]
MKSVIPYANNNDTFAPKVSVVIPIYNGEADLPDLINCLLAQTYPRHQVEYLLVDNNSSDRTLAILQETARHSQINIHPISENTIQSSYAARNKGIRSALGEIIAFTDADCRPQCQWLSSLVSPFTYGDVAIVAGEITALPGNTILEKYAELQNTLSQTHTLAHKFYPYGQTANLAIKRQVLAKVGLFRPYLTTGGDADICWRILQENMGRLQFAPEAIVQHRHRTTFPELHSQWQRYGRSNKYLHQLYGVDLMRDITLKEYGYRLGRWLLKELPRETVKLTTRQASLVNLLNTPIGLFTARARNLGQKQAQLPEKAKMIEWL